MSDPEQNTSCRWCDAAAAGPAKDCVRAPGTPENGARDGTAQQLLTEPSDRMNCTPRPG